MGRTLRQEINDLTVRLTDSGMSETSARTEAARIVAAIGAHYRTEALTQARAALYELAGH